MSGPLSGQLEELYVIPLHTVDGHWKQRANHSSADLNDQTTKQSWVRSEGATMNTQNSTKGNRVTASQIFWLPFRMVCCCLAEQMSRLMPSITWLFESTSFSFVFFPKKMGTEGRQRERVTNVNGTVEKWSAGSGYTETPMQQVLVFKDINIYL